MRWLVQPGDRVTRDQPIVEIQTDKALVEIPSPAAGTVARLGAGVGSIVKVGELLFVLDSGDGAGAGKEATNGGSTGAADAAREKEAARSGDDEPAAIGPIPVPSRDAARRVAAVAKAARRDAATIPATGPRRLRALAAPAVRKLAVELGVDLATVAGSGEGGRVLADDVRRAAHDGGAATTGRVSSIGTARSAASPEAARTGSSTAAALPSTALPRELGQAAPGRIPIAGVRRIIVQTMTQSWTTIPHIHGNDELDAQPLVDAVRGLRRRAAARAAGEGTADAGSLYTMSVFFVLAAARALRRFPLVNASLDLAQNEIDIGVSEQKYVRPGHVRATTGT